MAVLFFDGMDHMNSTQIPSKWDLGSTMNYGSSAGRFGGGAMSSPANNSGLIATKSLPTGSTFIVGFALKLDTATPNSSTIIFRLMDGLTSQVELRLGTSGQIQVYTNGSSVATSANGLILINTWYYIEFKVTITSSTSANQCVVRINNNVVINATSVSTQTTGTTNATACAIGQSGFASTGTTFDDFNILDNTGPQCNDLLGDCRIETTYPDGAGNYTQLTPNGAVANYNCVNEHPADDDTTYVSGNSVSNVDTYTFGNPSGTITSVFAVQSNIRARKDNAGTRTIARVVRISGSDYVSSDYSLSTSYSLFRDIMELNPDTGVAWTSSDIAALEAGVQITN